VVASALVAWAIVRCFGRARDADVR
jgi:hypothetical protein